MKKIWCAATGIAGIGIGYLLHSSPRQTTDNVSRPSAVMPASSREQQTGPAENISSLKKAAQRQTHPAEKGTTDATQSDLLNQLAGRNPARYREIQSIHEMNMLRELFGELAGSDPAHAAALLNGIHDPETRQALTQKLISSWSETDPKATYRWYQNHEGQIAESDKEFYLENILSPLAKQEPEYAWSIINTIQNPDQKEMMLMDMANNWIAKDSSAAFNWLKSLMEKNDISPTTLKNCYSMAMTKYMEIDLDGASRIISELESESLQVQLMEPMIQKLAETDLYEAMAWIQNLSNPAAREAGMTELIYNQGNNNPEAVLNYALMYAAPTEAGMDLISTAFLEVGDLTPDLAAKKLMQVPDKIRPQIIESLTLNWLDQDEEEAIKWINKQPAGPSLDAGASQAAQHYLNENPTQAIHWACKIGDPEKQTTILSEIIEYADRNDLEELCRVFKNASISPADRVALQTQLNDRINDEYAELILP